MATTFMDKTDRGMKLGFSNRLRGLRGTESQDYTERHNRLRKMFVQSPLGRKRFLEPLPFPVFEATKKDPVTEYVRDTFTVGIDQKMLTSVSNSAMQALELKVEIDFAKILPEELRTTTVELEEIKRKVEEAMGLMGPTANPLTTKLFDYQRDFFNASDLFRRGGKTWFGMEYLKTLYKGKPFGKSLFLDYEDYEPSTHRHTVVARHVQPAHDWLKNMVIQEPMRSWLGDPRSYLSFNHWRNEWILSTAVSVKDAYPPYGNRGFTFNTPLRDADMKDEAIFQKTVRNHLRWVMLHEMDESIEWKGRDGKPTKIFDPHCPDHFVKEDSQNGKPA